MGYQWIQYQILWTNIISIVWHTVIRISKEYMLCFGTFKARAEPLLLVSDLPLSSLNQNPCIQLTSEHLFVSKGNYLIVMIIFYYRMSQNMTSLHLTDSESTENNQLNHVTAHFFVVIFWLTKPVNPFTPMISI